jgi:hypothetical protein
MTSNTFISEFSKATQNVCLCLGVSFFIIIVFLLSPLNRFILSSVFGKISVLLLLGYTLYYNTTQTNKFANKYNIKLHINNWTSLKTNVLCSYIFSVFLLVLMYTIIHK